MSLTYFRPPCVPSFHTRIPIALTNSQLLQIETRHSSSGQPPANSWCPGSLSALFPSKPHTRGLANFPRLGSLQCCVVYSCVYLPILILAITRMACHVKGRFAHSLWMGQYWQHAHRISDRCKGLAHVAFTAITLNAIRRQAILIGNPCKCQSWWFKRAAVSHRQSTAHFVWIQSKVDGV